MFIYYHTKVYMDSQVAVVLREWGFSDEVVEKFREQEIDGEAFLALTPAIIGEIFPKAGPRAKFLKLHNALITVQGSNLTEGKVVSIGVGTGAAPANPQIQKEALPEILSPISPPNSCEPADLDSLDVFLHGIDIFAGSSGLEKGLELGDDSPESDKGLELIKDSSPVLDKGSGPESNKGLELVKDTSLDLDEGSDPGCSQGKKNVSQIKEAKKGKRSQQVLDIGELLQVNTTGQVIYHTAKKGPLDSKTRRKLAELIINAELNGDPFATITSSRFVELSEEVVSTCPREIASLYYVPYCNDNGKKKLASGALVNAYYNLRKSSKILKIEKETAVKKKVLEISKDIQDIILWLKNCCDPWPTVESRWALTFEHRRDMLLREGEGKLFEYMDRFRPLRQPLGYQLFEIDFNQIYPGKDIQFIAEWPSFSKKALDLLLRLKLPSSRLEALSNLSTEKSSCLPAAILISLAALVEPVVVSVKSKTRPAWKPSRQEVQDGFITHVTIEGEVKATISRRQVKFQELKQTVQPYVIIVGETIEKIVSSYIVVDQTVYKVESTLRAVEVAFKTHFALHANYSVESKPLWMLIQKAIYHISTPYDQGTANFAVRNLLSLFNEDLDPKRSQKTKR